MKRRGRRLLSLGMLVGMGVLAFAGVQACQRGTAVPEVAGTATRASSQPAAVANTEAETAAAEAAFHGKVLPLLQQYCYQCHGNGAHKGDLALDQFKTVADMRKDPGTWELVMENVRKGLMPPPGAKAVPTGEERQVVTGWIETGLFAADANNPDVGRVTARRLNRAEYNNTVRDLLGVDFQPAADFPPDDSGYGFDNIGDVLSMSPTLLEKYLKAAEKVSRRALFGVEALKPETVTHQPWYIDFDTVRVVKTEYDETGLSMPYSAHVMHRFPVEAEYEIMGMTRGFRPPGSNPIRLGFWVDGKLVGEGKVPVSVGPVPPPGELNGLHDSVRLRVAAGEHWVAVTILNNYEGLPRAYGGPKPSESTAGMSKVPTENLINNVIVTGPFDQVKGPLAESLKKIFICGHAEGKHTAECEGAILTNLAHRAFRRPVTKEEVDRLVALADRVQKDGDSFEEGLCQAIQSILISPHFLYRIESDVGTAAAGGAGQARKLNPHELASRLSYFLWSSMPDEELLACADDGRLLKPEVLEAQTRRMIKDPKSVQFTENFGGQWLQFRGLDFHTVERKKFQQYTDYTIMSMREETKQFFDHLMREDRSVLELIDSKYTYLNQRLAEFYGIPGVKGHEFRRVELPESAHRGGVLTQASVLTISSYATRTSPVIRGKWILENLLNAAPPPPPPDIPALKEESIGLTASLREQLQKHRENAACASCHARMDPLGFGLDNFDAIGRWRTKDGQFDIDPSGVLPDGRAFQGVEELKAILMTQKEAFGECLTDKMLTYALGRGLTRADHKTVAAIAGELGRNEYRFSSVVLGIVKSAPFQMRGAVSSTAAVAPHVRSVSVISESSP